MAPKAKSIEQLRQELAAQQKLLEGLKAKRAKLAARLAKLDGQIAATAGEGKPKRGRPKKVAKAKRGRPKKAAKAKRGRPKKAAKAKRGRPKKVAKAKRGRPKKVVQRKRATGKPLGEYLRAALAGKPDGMRVKDVTAAVAKAGYKSFAADFYAIVATALRDKKKFKNLRRGVYAVR